MMFDEESDDLLHIQSRDTLRCISYSVPVLHPEAPQGFGLVIGTESNYWDLTAFPVAGEEHPDDGVEGHRQISLAGRVERLLSDSFEPRKVYCKEGSAFDNEFLPMVVDDAGCETVLVKSDKIADDAVRELVRELKWIKNQSNFPDSLWFFAARYIADCHNHKKDELGKLPAQKFFGDDAKPKKDLTQPFGCAVVTVLGLIDPFTPVYGSYYGVTKDGLRYYVFLTLGKRFVLMLESVTKFYPEYFPGREDFKPPAELGQWGHRYLEPSVVDWDNLPLLQ